MKISGVISGASKALTIGGTSTVTLMNTETYTGATTINNGATLSLGDGTTAGTLDTASSITDNGTLTFNAPGDVTYAGVLTGTGVVNKLGTGILTLGNATTNSTYSGGTTVNAGTLKAGSSNAPFGTGAVTENSSGGVVIDLNGQTISNAMTLYSAASPTVYALTSSVTGGTQQTGTVTLGFNAMVGLATGNTMTISGAIGSSSTYGLTINNGVDAGTVVLSGNNSYTGSTTINSGVLSVSSLANGGSNSNIGASTNSASNLVLAGGTLRYSGVTASTNRNFTISSGSAGVFDISSAGATLTISGGAANTTGSLTKVGSGTLTLSGTNTYTGATTISAGTLQISSTGSLNNGSYAANISIDTGATLQYSSSTAQTLSGNISGAGALTKDTNSSTLTLSGTNTYTGTTTISVGTLALSNGAALADTNAVNLSTLNATLLLNASETIGSLTGAASSSVSLGGNTLTVGDASSTTYAGVISGSGGSLTKVGSGTLTLSGTNTYTGTTTISAGTLLLGGNNVISSSSGLILSGTAVLDLHGYSNTFASLTGASGNTILNNQSASNSVLTVAGGTTNYAGLIIDHSTGSGTVGLNVTGGSLSLTNLNTYTGVTTVSSGATIEITNLGNGGSASGIGQAGNGAANIMLDGGTLKYTGATTASDRLITITTNGGTINASGTGILVLNNIGNIGLSGSGTHTLTLAGSNTGNNSLAAVLADSGSYSSSLYKDGVGTWVISGNSSYTGVTTIHAGTLIISGSSSVSNSSGVIVDGILDISNLGGTVSAKTISSSNPGLGQILIGGDRLNITNASGIFYGAISGTGSLAISGGTLTLAGNNSFTGGITISNSILKYGVSAGALSNGNITSSNGSLGARSDLPLVTLNTGITITGALKLVGDIKSTGNQSYQDITVNPASGALVTLTSTAGNISMLGTIDGLNSNVQSLNIISNASAGIVTLAGSNGSNAPLNNFSVTANRINLLADTLTSGTQTYTGSSYIGDASYIGQAITQGFLFGQFNSIFTDTTKGLLIKYLSPNYVRTLVSRDPSVTFNGTIDDTVKDTHTLITLAISDVSSLDPAITFSNSIGNNVPLYGLNVATKKTGSTYAGEITITGLGVITYTNQSYSANSMSILPASTGGAINFTISDIDGLINFTVNPVDPDYPGYLYIRGELNPTPVVVSNYIAIKGATNIKVSELNGTWNATITAAYTPVTPSPSSDGSGGSTPIVNSQINISPVIEPVSKEKEAASGTPTTNAGTIMQDISQNNNFTVYRPAVTSVANVSVTLAETIDSAKNIALSPSFGATSSNVVASGVGAITEKSYTSATYILAQDQAPKEVAKGSSFVYQLPANIFIHSVPGTAMEYEAKQVDGSALPYWMKFNPVQLSFSGVAPIDAQPSYDISIMARDKAGNQASAKVTVIISSR